jgi:hypothetical protein
MAGGAGDLPPGTVSDPGASLAAALMAAVAHCMCVSTPTQTNRQPVYIYIKLTHQQCMCCSSIDEVAAAWLTVLAAHPRAPCQTQGHHLLLLSWQQRHVWQSCALLSPPVHCTAYGRLANLNHVCCSDACELAAAWLVVLAAHPHALCQTQEHMIEHTGTLSNLKS